MVTIYKVIMDEKKPFFKWTYGRQVMEDSRKYKMWGKIILILSWTILFQKVSIFILVIGQGVTIYLLERNNEKIVNKDSSLV